MKFTREQHEGIYTIHAFNSQSATLNSPDPGDERDEEGRLELSESFIISPYKLITAWPPSSLSDVEGVHLSPIAALQPEVLLLGSGTQMRLPPQQQLEALIALGVGYEIMDSAAACRTYNILAGEGRAVAAAIIIEK